MAFVSCSSCERFVAPSDKACPFCGTTITHPAATPKRRPFARSAMLAAAIAAGPACSSSSSPDDAGSADDAGMVTDSGTTTDAGPIMDAAPDTFDAGMPLPPYGIPPSDAGADDAGDDVEIAPAYGAPPPDAG